jgi:hypothetical protein
MFPFLVFKPISCIAFPQMIGNGSGKASITWNVIYLDRGRVTPLEWLTAVLTAEALIHPSGILPLPSWGERHLTGYRQETRGTVFCHPLFLLLSPPLLFSACYQNLHVVEKSYGLEG